MTRIGSSGQQHLSSAYCAAIHGSEDVEMPEMRKDTSRKDSKACKLSSINLTVTNALGVPQPCRLSCLNSALCDGMY